MIPITVSYWKKKNIYIVYGDSIHIVSSFYDGPFGLKSDWFKLWSVFKHDSRKIERKRDYYPRCRRQPDGSPLTAAVYPN